MSDTPRTDALEKECVHDDYVVSYEYFKDLCYELERDLSGARKACRLAVDAFENNWCIDWSDIEKHASNKDKR